jgi:hypothetical protein
MVKRKTTKRRGCAAKPGIVMSEFKHHRLHSGSKHGKIVRSHAQAVAIALSVQRRCEEGSRARKRKTKRRRGVTKRKVRK